MKKVRILSSAFSVDFQHPFVSSQHNKHVKSPYNLEQTLAVQLILYMIVLEHKHVDLVFSIQMYYCT